MSLNLISAQPNQTFSYNNTSTWLGGSQSQNYLTSALTLFGSNGLQIPISLPQTNTNFDYTIMFSFRLTNPQVSQSQTLIDTVGGPTCILTSNQLQCTTGQQISLNQIPDCQNWVQFTYITNFSSNTSLLRIDQPPLTLSSNGTYTNINSSTIYLGISSNLTRNTGLQGDIREFYMRIGQLSASAIPAMMSNVKIFDLNTLAYFQFNPSIGILTDSFRYQFAQVVGSSLSQAPILVIDEGSQLICDSLDLNPYQSLPNFYAPFDSQMVKIQNFQFSQPHYSYTMSMWIKIDGTQSYSSSVNDGITNNDFFVLENSFALWFDSPSSFRVHIFGNQNYQEVSTISLPLPVNQWANIQLVLDQVNGFAVIINKQNGKRIQNYTIQTSLLPQQTASGKIQLWNNFRGTVKQVQLWQNFYQLPVRGNETNNLLFTLSFIQNQYQRNSWSSISSDSFSYPGSQGFSFYQTKVPSDNLYFQKLSLVGVFNSTETIWDGIGCNTNKNTQAFFNGTVQNTVMFPQSNSIAAEFWFRINSSINSNNTIILLQIQSSSGSKQTNSLTIYIDSNGVLKCAPFGIFVTNYTLIYNGINVLNETRWQHVSCSFTQQNKVIGQYLAYGYQGAGQMKDLLPITFGLSLSSCTLRTPNYLMGMNYQIFFGSVNLPAFYKDVKVWSNYRSPEDLYAYRFRQVNSMSTQALLFNYKLLNGNLTLVNEAQLGGSPTGVMPILFKQDGLLLICPSDKLFDPINFQCVLNPFNNLPLTYIAQNTQQNGLQIIFSNKYRTTNLALPTQQVPVQQNWQIDNPQIQNAQVNTQNSQTDLYMNPYTLGDGYNYTISQLQIGGDSMHNFWANITQVFYPRKCAYLVDSVSFQPFNQISTFRIKNANQQLCVNMNVMTADGCYGNFYNQLQNFLTIQSSPNINNLQNLTTYTVNTQNNSIRACLPASLLAVVYGNIPINLVFGVYWATDQAVNQPLSYINAVYQLIVIDDIQAKLKASTNQVDFNSSVILDASQSYYLNQNNSNNGLYFKWRCPTNFQPLCDKYEGIPVMEITPAAYQAYQGVPLLNQTFYVDVWSLLSGSQPQNTAQVYSASVVLQWATFAPPIFQINVPLLPGQTIPRIVSSQNVTLSLNLINYRQSDPRLSYSWQIQPYSQFNAQFSNLSVDGSMFILMPGALNQNTTYTLSVTVTNVVANGSVGIQQLNFTTGTPPTAGQFTVLPTSGTMFSTLFVIALNGWVSSVGGVLRVNLWGITQLSTQQLIQIGSPMQPMNFSGLSISSEYLPLIQAVQVSVYDLVGEVTTMNQTVQVQRPSSNTAWQDVTNSIISQYGGSKLLQQKYQYFAFVCQNCAQDYSYQITTQQDCQAAEMIMIQQAFLDLQVVNTDDTSVQSAQILTSIVQMLVQATQYSSIMNNTIANSATSIIQTISGKIGAFQTAVGTSTFQQQYTQTIANLIAYQTMFVQPFSVSKRNLQTGNPQAVINALIVQKNALLDALCSLPQGSQVLSSSIYLVAQQYSITDLRKDVQFLNQLDKSSLITVPLDELLRTSTDFDSNTTSVCLQVSFMSQSPIPGFQFTNQMVLNQTFIQVSSLDDQMNRILSQIGLQNLQLNPFTLTTKFNFNSKQFHNNQTICMGYNANISTPMPWTSNSCQTNYTDKAIFCSCSSLNNYYYAIVNDYSRVEYFPYVSMFQFTWPFIVILIPLLLGLCLPCFAIYLDKLDFEAVQENKYLTVTDQLIDNLRIKRGYSCNQIIYYKLKDIQIMQEWKKFTFCSAYYLMFVNLNPKISLFMRFDYKHSRLVRASVLMIQVAIQTLLIIAFYIQGLITNFIVLIIFLGLLAFPIPSFLMWIIRSEIKFSQPKKEDKIKNIQNETPEPEVIIKDRCILLRVLFITICFLVYFLTIVIVGLYTNGVYYSHKVQFRQDVESAQYFLMVWILVIAWGLLLNIIRVFFISIFAYRRAKQIKKLEDQEIKAKNPSKTDKQNVISSGGVQNKNTSNIAISKDVNSKTKQKELTENEEKILKNDSCSLTYLIFPHESVEICLDAIWTIQIYAELNQNQQQNQHTQKNDQTQDGFIDKKANFKEKSIDQTVSDHNITGMSEMSNRLKHPLKSYRQPVVDQSDQDFDIRDDSEQDFQNENDLEDGLPSSARYEDHQRRSTNSIGDNQINVANNMAQRLQEPELYIRNSTNEYQGSRVNKNDELIYRATDQTDEQRIYEEEQRRKEEKRRRKEQKKKDKGEKKSKKRSKKQDE